MQASVRPLEFLVDYFQSKCEMFFSVGYRSWSTSIFHLDIFPKILLSTFVNWNFFETQEHNVTKFQLVVDLFFALRHELQIGIRTWCSCSFC